MKFTSSILLLAALSASVFASPHDHDHNNDDDNTVTVTKTVTVTSTDYMTRSTFQTFASSTPLSTPLSSTSSSTSSTLSSDNSSPTGDSDGTCIANYHACTPNDTCCDNFQCVGYTQWNSGTCVNR